MPRGSRMRALMNWSKLWPLMTSISRAVTSVASERSEEHTSELQSQSNLVCRLLLEKQTERALRAIVNGDGEHADDPIAAVQASYDRGITDEFIEPVVIDGRPRLDPDRDTAIFFNFRPDRTRQLAEKLGELGVDLTTMTRYRDDFAFPVAFAEHIVEHTLAEVLSAHGIRQLHSAETEKYAHVTYFLDGGREEPFAGEERILVDSPRDVPSYDHKPQMSAPEVAQRVVQAIEGDGYGSVVGNFANPAMGGHTGVIPAGVRARDTAAR